MIQLVMFGNGVQIQIFIKITIIMLQLMVAYGKKIVNTECCVVVHGTMTLTLLVPLTVSGTTQSGWTIDLVFELFVCCSADFFPLHF